MSKNVKENINTPSQTSQTYSVEQLKSLKIVIEKPMIVFLYGDLWAGKTTLSQYILWELLWIDSDICSPTYTYYNKYWEHYHFDLYRLGHYDEFFAIWWEEILDNHTGVVLIEWPEIIEPYYTPDLSISLEKTSQDDVRNITFTYHK